ncbi:hypothetical protein HPB51_006519 [Rhipicephalus microplus]|uniref:Uncharacterized protein n=1 Tax=Rhipicephalus microplus TaxID=6941 RepID=A0A9J6E6I6_RHIMP|nr:hypothetical protein HPB51_006519 [Rhipicephalus microplus]
MTSFSPFWPMAQHPYYYYPPGPIVMPFQTWMESRSTDSSRECKGVRTREKNAPCGACQDHARLLDAGPGQANKQHCTPESTKEATPHPPPPEQSGTHESMQPEVHREKQPEMQGKQSGEHADKKLAMQGEQTGARGEKQSSNQEGQPGTEKEKPNMHDKQHAAAEEVKYPSAHEEHHPGTQEESRPGEKNVKVLGEHGGGQPWYYGTSSTREATGQKWRKPSRICSPLTA